MHKERRMKKVIIFLSMVLLLTVSVFAQTPELYLTGSSNFDYDIVIEASFFPYIEVMDNLASTNNIQIKVQQSFRKADGQITGNIVPPADRSNHLVGHAIDINLVYNGVWYNSSNMTLANYNNLPQAIKNFISGCENAGMRWGGRFTPADPVHFDSGININNRSWYDRWYAGIQQLYLKECFYEPHK
jgi:hypothetical protein